MRRPLLLLPLLLGAVLPACGTSDPTPAPTPANRTTTVTLSASPSHASMFGQVDVTLDGDFSALGAVHAVTFDGIHALDLRATASRITVHIQGAPTSGPAHIVVLGEKGSRTNDTSFTYDPPAGGAPTRWAAFGASLTQGFQSGGLQAHGQEMSWDAQVARAAGVFLGPPLVVDTFLPPLEPSAFVKSCGATWSEGAIASSLLETLTNPTTHQSDLRLGRQDATLATRNFAVGGATVADIIAPAGGTVGILERVSELPDGQPGALFTPPLTRSQIDRLVELDPEIAVSGDLLANDSDAAVVQADDLHPEQMTPVSTLAPELATLAKRLGRAHGHYFIGNLVPLDGLPNVAVLRTRTIAAGSETQASFDAKVATIRAVIQQYNDALASAVAPYPNLHVVDLATPTRTVLTNGIDVGGQKLTGHQFGGLLSLDFLHFTDTGYAIMANVFIDAINQTRGLHIPKVDVAGVLADDALSPASLFKDGVRCKGQ